MKIQSRQDRLNEMNSFITENGYHQIYLDEIEKDFIAALQMCKNKFNQFSFKNIEVDDKNLIIATIYGGTNGCGTLSNYFNSLAILTNSLYQYFFIRSWLINIENDCLDDIFTAKFAIRYIDRYDDRLYQFKRE